MLQHPDTFHLSAAIGWLELGNHLEANDELEKITPQMRAHPDVLNVRYQIYAGAKKWMEAHTIAKALVEMVPTEPGHWIAHAYSSRRKPDGGIEEAKTILLKAASIFPTEPTIFFNLACYDSLLGKFPESKAWLDKALKVGDRATVQKMILEDSDLEPLRKEYGM